MTLFTLRVRFPVTAAGLGTQKLFGFKGKRKRKPSNNEEKEKPSKQK